MSKFDNRPKNKSVNRSPKSAKADGTPKKRWSSAERAAKGHDPRRRGGQRRDESTERSDRPASGERFIRTDRAEGELRRPERGPRRDRMNDDRRPFNRDDRGSSSRDGRGSFKRDDRGSFGRDDRRSFNRDDRGSFGRDDRGGRSFNRDDRGSFNRDDRGGRSFNRDDRGSSSRDDRGGRSFERRDDRPRFSGERRSDRTWDRAGRDSREDRYARQNRAPRSRFDEGAELAFDADIMEWNEAAELDLASVDVSNSAGFADMGLPAALVAALAAEQITQPFPIQAATIPVALAGQDVLGRGRTGSGKTLAFGLPMLTRISTTNGVKGAAAGIVLVPTRELAMQVADALSPLAKAVGLSLALIAGGMSYGPQVTKLSKGVDIIVATPGRLIDLMEQGVADLSHIQVTVLDEADHMADLGFMPAVTTLLDATPEGAQRLLFSATLDGAVDTLVKKYMTDPSLHEVDQNRASVTTMAHHLLLAKPHHKNELTARIANREGRTVIFARTQLGASRIAEQLRGAGVMAGALHGGLTQGARARVLEAFKSGQVPVLVATDVAARGIHVDDVTLVLQVDPPMNSKDYLHRAGRTARAGHEGAVVSIVLPHQRRATQRLVGAAGVKTEPVEVAPGDEQLVELTGARELTGEPISDAEYEQIIAPPRRAPREGRGGKRRDFGGRERGFGGRGSRDGRGGGARGGRDFGGRGQGRSFNQPGRNKAAKPRNDQIAQFGGWND